MPQARRKLPRLFLGAEQVAGLVFADSFAPAFAVITCTQLRGRLPN